MLSAQNERPNLANFPDLPRNAKIQPSRGHWYVFVTKYAYDPVKKRSVQVCRWNHENHRNDSKTPGYPSTDWVFGPLLSARNRLIDMEQFRRK